ncbi:MAG: InlB B-repeat-containing protein [Ruminococcus sp.]|nr:InlB B-repeat-containing protein [Ruminococcus sp.]
MNSFKTAIIAGAAALAVLIATIVVVTNGNSAYGLYISSVSGNVTVSNSSDGTNAAASADTFLKSGDVLTVNDGASCTVIYRTRDNFDENYVVLEPSTQVFVTGKFTGKSDDELYLNRGAVLVSSLEKAKRNVIVRTENASVTTAEAAVRIEYELGDEHTDTLIASFGGAAKIQMYDAFGNPISRDGTVMQSSLPEDLGNGLSAKIVSGDVPKYDYLNIPTVLEDYKAKVLRELLTVSAFHELAFSSADIKAAYDAAPSDETGTADTDTPPVTEQITESVTAVTTPAEETTETVSETVTTAVPVQTTAAPRTTTAAPATTTVPPATTAPPETTTTADDRMITISILIDDEIITQEVPYGGNAVQPDDPVVEGKRFIGWDGSFDNITEEIIISAIFEDDGSLPSTTAADTEITFTVTSDPVNTLTVTVSVNGSITTQQVVYGGSAVLPAVSIPGYIFMGWDRSPDNITENCTITAILVPDSSDSIFSSDAKTYTVTFIVDGVPYPVTVTEGSGAVAPVSPTTNSLGQSFVGWDTDFSSVHSDITVNAIFF